MDLMFTVHSSYILFPMVLFKGDSCQLGLCPEYYFLSRVIVSIFESAFYYHFICMSDESE